MQHDMKTCNLTAQTGVVNLVFDQTATGLQNDCHTITTNSMHCSAAAQLIYFQVFSFLNNIAVYIYCTSEPIVTMQQRAHVIILLPKGLFLHFAKNSLEQKEALGKR